MGGGGREAREKNRTFVPIHTLKLQKLEGYSKTYITITFLPLSGSR